MQQSLGCGNVQCTCPQQGALSPLRLVDIISSHVYSILIYASALPHQQGTFCWTAEVTIPLKCYLLAHFHSQCSVSECVD